MNKSRLFFILKVVVSVSLFAWFFFSVDWREVVASFARMQLFGVAGAAAMIILAMVVSVVKWGLLLKAQGLQAGWMALWRAYWVGLFFNNFLPSSIGGDGMRILLIGQKTKDMAGASLSVVAERVLATLGIALAALPALMIRGEIFPNIRYLFFLLILISLFLLWLLVWGRVPGFIKNRSGKIAVFLNGFIDHGGLLKKKPLILLQVTFWSVVFQLANIAVNYFIFRGLGLELSYLDAMAVIPAAAVISMLPVGINGYGLREGTYIALLAPLGVGSADAFTASVLYAFIISVCSLWGGLVWLTDRKKGEIAHAGTTGS